MQPLPVDPVAFRQELVEAMAEIVPPPSGCTCQLERPPWPCRPHCYEEHLAWLGDVAPRLRTAITQGDEFVACDRWPSDPAEVPEFAPFLAALSPDARSGFVETWGWSPWSSYPETWEHALIVRDGWQMLLPAAERDGMRRAIERLLSTWVDHPLASSTPEGEVNRSGCELMADWVADRESLAIEADLLGQLADLAGRGQAMIRDYLVGDRLATEPPPTIGR